MIVDSHCHLNYLENVQQQLASAREAGVSGFLCIGVNAREFPQISDITADNPDVWCTAGVHPDPAGEGADLTWLEQTLLEVNGVVGVGETGLDYTSLSECADIEQTQHNQGVSFSHHLNLAEKHNMPVIVHTRDAQKDTLEFMSRYPGAVGVLHCFTENWEMACTALEMGYYISISGIVTFKNARQVQDVANKIPAERLLLETDSPWLSPVPHRGKKNQPAFVCDTARYVAQLRGISYEEIAELTSNNFYSLFGKIPRS
ncbi:MAG: TatD family hydrolase [Pseudomonadales bacterium]|nr:TatD family hydrolase [Pseudomonadales bacterium]